MKLKSCNAEDACNLNIRPERFEDFTGQKRLNKKFKHVYKRCTDKHWSLGSHSIGVPGLDKTTLAQTLGQFSCNFWSFTQQSWRFSYSSYYFKCKRYSIYRRNSYIKLIFSFILFLLQNFYITLILCYSYLFSF